MSRAQWLAVFCLFSLSAFAQHTGVVVNCSGGASLQQAVAGAPPNSVLVVRGACTGPVTITTDGLRLLGGGTASINAGGGGSDAVTINGAQRVELNGMQITGGVNGVVAKNGAQLNLVNDVVTGNGASGVVAESSSAILASGGSNSANGFNGVDLEGTSSLTVTGSYSLSSNGVFGINVNNGSSLWLSQASLAVNGNTLGVQLGTNASGFLDNFSTLDTSNNFTVGLTMVSGSHMVDFGGTIRSNGNGINGISLNSKAGLDMDAAAQVTSNNNGVDGVHLEQQSVMSIFNNPQFSGAQGTTTLTTQGNQGSGVNLLMGSEILVDNYAAIVSSGNVLAGLATDDGSAVQFRQTIPVNGVQTTITGNHPDLQLSFGSRLTTLANDIFGTVACDATVLTRGANSPTCPQGTLRRR